MWYSCPCRTSADSVEAGAAGLFAEERAAWLVQGRRGSTDFAGRLLDSEDPRYWDAFAKLDVRLGDRHGVRANLLHADDRLSFAEALPDSSKRTETDYDSSYLWLTHQAVAGSKALIESCRSIKADCRWNSSWTWS